VTSATRARRLAGLASELLLLTAAAQVTTLPLTLLYFQRFSLGALPVNFLVLPLQPLLMLTSGLSLLLGLVWLPLGQLAAWLAWPWSAYTLGVIRLAASVPGASFYLGEVTPAVTAALYGLLFGVTWALGRAGSTQPPWWRDQVLPRLPAGGLVVAFSATVLLWSYYFSLPVEAGRLRVSVLDVGEGEAVLIQAPNGTNVLIGGGAGGRTLSRALGQQLPLGTTVVHLLVIAAPDESHLGALPEVLDRYTIQHAILTGAEGRGAAYRVTLDRLYAEAGVEVTEASGLPAYELGDGINLRVLADGEDGTTLRLEWNRFALVLPVGLDEDSARSLTRRGLAQPATALLLGPEAAMTPEWLAALDPRLVLISTEAGSGYPDAATLAQLAGRSVLRTDVNGTLTVETDGVQLWVRAER
jgi:competence protein ComEC